MRGRETERDATRALLDRAERGAGGVLLVDGEPGIGKSLLLRECEQDAAARGFAVVAGAASRLEQTLPFSTLRGAMPELFAASRDGAGPRDDDAPRRDDAGLDVADATGRWTARVRGYLERRAITGPVLVCLDDLHWACPGTLAVAVTLSRDLRRDRVAWLLARTGTAAGAADRAFRSLETGGAPRVTLGPLGPEAVTGMLADAFGAPPGDGLEDLAGGAAGNPSLLAELVSGLRAGRAVRVAEGRAVLSSGGLPDGVIDLARRRLEVLSGRARHLVVTAAVLDPEFRFEDAAEMLTQAPAALLPVLAEAIEAGIMTAGELTFAFRHPLLRRAVAETIPGPARRALHRQYGEILLTRGESAGQAASHLLCAARPGDGAAGLDSAAARVASVAPEAAADLAVRALELTPLASPDAVPRRVAAAEALAVAGRLADAGRIAREALARPVAVTAEARLRCVLSA
ncbi:MAG: ATP-binding protein, partial [Trebonia sp.]